MTVSSAVFIIRSYKDLFSGRYLSDCRRNGSYDIFSDATSSYHVADHVDAPSSNPHPEGSIEAVLWAKNYIDAVQWHLEDIIRDPDIDPVEALAVCVVIVCNFIVQCCAC